MGEFVVRHRQRVVGRRRVVFIFLVVDIVIPGCAAHTQAEIVTKNQVHFGQQIETIGDESAALEVTVAVVAVKRRGAGSATRSGWHVLGEGVVLAFDTHTG
jgi:hypothetical protein